jgi:hypothetical protein
VEHDLNPYVSWFQRALGLGTVLNVLMIIGLFVAPTFIMELLHIPPPDPIWVRTVGLLIGWISIAYLPALMDPLGWVEGAVYTVGVRVSGIVFFGGAVLLLGAPLGFITFALYDLTFVTLQGGALYLMLQHEKKSKG